MKLTSKPVIVTIKVIFWLAGFALGLIGNQVDKTEPQFVLLECIISAIIIPIVGPFTISFLVRIIVAIGFYKPSWEAPTLASNPFDYRDPLPFFQFASFLLTVVGIGATISIIWKGLSGVGLALIGFSGGLACYLGLFRLMKTYSPIQSNTQER
jgi:hypothetical protein